MDWLKRNAFWLQWILAVGLLILLFWWNREGLQDLSTRRIIWTWFAAAIVCRFASLCLTFSRWWLLVTGIGLPLRWLDAFRLGMLGEASNFLLPGSAGGDLVKAVFLAKDHRERRASAAATVVLDRILGLWALFLSGALASLIPSSVPLGPKMQIAVMFLWAGSAGGLIGLVLMLIPAFTHSRLMHWLTTWKRIGKIVQDLMDSIAFYQNRRHIIAFSAILSLLGHVGFLTAFYLVALSLHSGRPMPNYVDHLVGLPLPEAIAAIPLTPGGVGTLEGAVGYFYEQHQLSLDPKSTPKELESAAANGFLTALGHRVAALVIASIGLIYFFAGRKETRDAAASAEIPETVA